MPGGQREDGAVQSVKRAFEVLDVLSSTEQGMGVSGLVDQTGLPYATIHRLLRTLTESGYAWQDPGSRRYMLGSRLVKLGNAANRLFDVWGRPFLAELVEVSGETANLAVLEEPHAVYVAQVASGHRVRMFTEVGNRVLPHTSAVGKVLLAFHPRPVAERIIERTGLPQHTPNSITEYTRFMAELERVAAEGVALDDEEEELGVRCVAVPVFGIGGAVAGMSVSGPTGRLEPDTCDQLVPRMRAVADSIAAGHAAPTAAR
jgi:IclR family acetate operon transcriptional repressor